MKMLTTDQAVEYCNNVINNQFIYHVNIKSFNGLMSKWMHENFGNNLIKYDDRSFGNAWWELNEDARWQISGFSMCFKNKEDAVLFKLIWS